MDLNTLLIIKILVTAFVAVLIPVYWKTYGISNFLWLSDIGLFMTVIALWIHSPLLISIATVLILPFEVIWIIDYLLRLLIRHRVMGVTNYMFDSQYPLTVRALSLFHIPLPVLWVWLIYRWGYDIDAPIYATILVWIVLLITYFSTDPKKNINWTHVPAYKKWHHFPGFLWMTLLLIGFPLLVILPMHLLLIYLTSIHFFID